MGQGLLTVLIQCAVEVTRTAGERVPSEGRIRASSSAPGRPPARARRCSPAALPPKRRRSSRPISTRALTLADLVGRIYAGEVKIDDTTALGATKNGVIKTHTAFGWATQMVVLDDAGAVARVVAAHDVGRAINPQQCEAQVQGAVHMGLGYALTEELPCRDGVPVTFDMRNIGVLRAQHMPEVEVILVEEPEPEGPFGAKGVGEIGLVPTAGAVAAALEAFDGQRRMTLPMKDSPAARAINVGRIPDADRDQWH